MLELYVLPPPPSPSSPPAPLAPTLKLALPPMSPGALILRIWCRAEPNARPTRSGTSASAPFASDPAQAIILFSIIAHDTLQLHHLSLIIHRAALLAQLPSPSLSSSSVPSTSPPPDLPVVEWPAWGPRACLWLDSDALATRWITVGCGQRLVTIRHDAPPAWLHVYDFNARSVRRRRAAARAEGRLEPVSAHSEGTRDPHTLFVRRTALLSTVFEEPVVSELLYARAQTAEEGGYESVMMDEGVLIGVKVRLWLVHGLTAAIANAR